MHDLQVDLIILRQKENKLSSLLALRQVILKEKFTLQLLSGAHTLNPVVYNLGDILPYNLDTTLLVLIDDSIDKLQKEIIFLNSIIFSV